MLKSYLITALRNVRRYKGYAFINIFGLATGLAACLLIGLYVRFELSFDRMHEKADRIVRVEMRLPNNPPGQQEWKANILPVGPELAESVTGIETAVRITSASQNAISVGNTRHYESGLHHTDPSYFDVFDFDIVRGSAVGLERPNSIMLSESMAEKYFPGENPLGRTVSVGEQYDVQTTDYEVIGVYEDHPYNAHVRPEFLASIATIVAEAGENAWSRLAYTYAVRMPGVSVETLSEQVAPYEKNTLQANFADGSTFAFRPLTRIHLHSGNARDIAPQGDIRYVWIFSGIAALILLIACINYMNLATARSSQRAREVGIRKVAGARRGQLAGQFLSESSLFAAVALILAVGLAQMALPAFSSMMDRVLSFTATDLDMIAGLVVVAVLVGLVSGSYPALLLSRLQPSAVLKGTSAIRSGTFLRKGLVVFQFVVSMALIVGTIVIQKQLSFVRETNLGFEKEQTVVLQTRGRLGENGMAFRDALARQAGVAGVTMASGVPGKPTAITFYASDDIEGYDGEFMRLDHLWIDHDFLSQFDMQIVEGRGFDRAFPSDLKSAVILNETAVEVLGWEDPIGKAFLDGEKREEVIGVVADFHLESMKSDINPVMIQVREDGLSYAAIKLSTADLPTTLTGLESVWDRFITDLPFQYSFLDDDFDAMYRSEQRLARLFNAFALVAIVIAALGLFGLAAYTAQRRTKEIGIRKVLGASVSGLVMMLSREFVRLVAIAFVLAAPIAYFAMENWLASFAYRIDIGVGTFLLAGAAALIIALGSVSWQALRAATSDPVKSLRYE